MPGQSNPISSTPPPDDEQTARTSQAGPNGDRLSFDGPAHTPARSLLKHFGRWVGDDVDELLAEVYRTRGKARF